jgi:hypothetical protein|tara:strand:- start:2838 stop:3521 length:684 start_codon:yes stop_codon:yes gene_type:complete
MTTNSTSGTYNFNLEIGDVIQEATEMIGGEITLGEEPRSARRSINLILNDWQNRGVCLWTTNTTIVSIAASTTAINLGNNISDVMQVVINRDNTDLNLTRISYEQYLILPNKGQTGRPSQYAIKRFADNVELYMWALSDNNTSKLKIEKIDYMQDVTKSAVQNADMPRRFLPSLTTGLAYYMSLKRPGITEARATFLKKEYEERLAFAMTEDKERASLYITPRMSSI